MTHLHTCDQHILHCLRVGPRSGDTAHAPPRWIPQGGNKHVCTLVLNSRVNRLTGEAEQGAPPAAGQGREEETDAVLHLVTCEQGQVCDEKENESRVCFLPRAIAPSAGRRCGLSGKGRARLEATRWVRRALPAGPLRDIGPEARGHGAGGLRHEAGLSST